MTQQGAIDMGTCWGTPSGQDLSSPSYMASGNLCVAEAILRRWSTGRGELPGDPNYGEQLTDCISDDMGPGDIAYKQQQLAAEAQKDERVQSCTVALSLSVDGTIVATASASTAAGPFRFVVTASQTSTSLLLVSP